MSKERVIRRVTLDGAEFAERLGYKGSRIRGVTHHDSEWTIEFEEEEE